MLFFLVIYNSQIYSDIHGRQHKWIRPDLSRQNNHRQSAVSDRHRWHTRIRQILPLSTSKIPSSSINSHPFWWLPPLQKRSISIVNEVQRMCVYLWSGAIQEGSNKDKGEEGVSFVFSFFRPRSQRSSLKWNKIDPITQIRDNRGIVPFWPFALVVKTVGFKDLGRVWFG